MANIIVVNVSQEIDTNFYATIDALPNFICKEASLSDLKTSVKKTLLEYTQSNSEINTIINTKSNYTLLFKHI